MNPALFARTKNMMRGFTLAEVLIATTLAMLVMLGLIGALFAFARTANGIDARIDEADAMRLLSGFLKQTLGQVAFPLSPRPNDIDATTARSFHGDPDTLSWIAPMPARHGVGGLHLLRLTTETSADGKRVLILHYRPYRARPSAVPVARTILLEDVRVLQLRFQPGHDASADPAHWPDHWHDDSRLPARVAIQLSTAATVWPPFIIALHPLPIADDDILH